MASGRTPLSSTAKPHQDTTASSVRARRHRLRAAESFVPAGAAPACLPALRTCCLLLSPSASSAPRPLRFGCTCKETSFFRFFLGLCLQPPTATDPAILCQEKKVTKKREGWNHSCAPVLPLRTEMSSVCLCCVACEPLNPLRDCISPLLSAHS